MTCTNPAVVRNLKTAFGRPANEALTLVKIGNAVIQSVCASTTFNGRTMLFPMQ